MSIYTPQGSYTLDTVQAELQIRLGIQGAPGKGKTFSGLTFPNPVVANFDRGLIIHSGRKDVVEVPFWKPEFVDCIIQRDGSECPPNRRDALLVWLSGEARKLGQEQTLVLDSNRQIEVAYHTQFNLNPPLSKQGQYNKFSEWTEKIKYFGELGTAYKTLKCNVVYICHEMPERTKEGESTGRIKPMLTGQSGDAIASDFTDWYRMWAIEKPKTQERRDACMEKFGLESAQLAEWCASSSTETIYLWQTQSDEIVECKTSFFNAPKFVVANYSTFLKYKRTVTQ